MSADHERLLPPNEPAAFESLCLDLWQEIWKDPGAQKNGRSGQPQAGVDVFGRSGGGWVGVQCKQKDGLLRSQLSVRELEAEVEKARAFRPRLSRFLVATSGPRDAKLQQRARELSEPGFAVEVWGWDDLWHELYGRRQLLARILPVYWPAQASLRPRRVAPTRPTHTADHLFGRDHELAALDSAWNAPSTHVVTLVAWGGVGKTSLVAGWAAQLAAREYDGADFFDWSFYSQGTREKGGASADTFVDAALRFFGDAAMADSARSPWDKGARLAQLVAERRTLLVLDGLEPLQHPPGPLAGQLQDPAVAALLKGLAGRNPGLCVVTTRERVVDLAAFEGSAAPRWELERLSTPAGVELLGRLGVHGAAAEVEQLVEDVQGHALTLNRLGRYLARAHGGDVRRRDRVELTRADRKVQGGHAFKTMAAYERWLATGGEEGQRQLAVLRLLGLFDRPADDGCLAALRRPPGIEGLTDPLVGLDEEDWHLALAELADSHLLPVTGTTLDAHPPVREHFARRLREEHPDAWKAAHGRLFDHLQDTTEYRPDTLLGLQPLYQAVVHGCQAGRYEAARDKVYCDRILRGASSYSTKKLGATGADLQAATCFFERCWNRVHNALPESTQAWLLHDAAFSLRALGRFREAVEPMRLSREMDVRRAEWSGAGSSSSSLGELKLALACVDAAVEEAHRSIIFADRSGNAFLRVVCRGGAADALHQAGRRVAAMSLCQEAESIQGEWLCALQGFRYCDLLLSDVERAAGSGIRKRTLRRVCRQVDRRARQALEWAVDSGLPLDVALDNLTIGRVRLYRAIVEGVRRPTANGYVDKAVDGFRVAGHVEFVPLGLLTRAWLRSALGDAAGARADLAEAEEIAKRGPMPLHLADVHLYRARLFHDRAALAEARRLVEKHGYGRRVGEIEDLEAVAGGW